MYHALMIGREEKNVFTDIAQILYIKNLGGGCQQCNFCWPTVSLSNGFPVSLPHLQRVIGSYRPINLKKLQMEA